MEHIADDQHHVRPQRDHSLHRTTEYERDVCLTLVDSIGREPVVLPEAEV